MVKLYFLGTDKRSKYLKKLFINEKKENIQIEVVNNIEVADVIVVPIPFSKDRVHITGESINILDFLKKCTGKLLIGGALNAYTSEFKTYNINYIDLMESDSIAYLNAIPTAEGAIYKAMEYTETTIHGSNALVLGFGRCGKILADKLKGLNANVFCEARNKKDLAHIKALGYNVVELNNIEAVLKDMDIIFSTIPAKILDREKLKRIKKDAIIIDLASSPGSVDYEECINLGINAYLELGLPSKVAPKSAARYLKEEIDNIIIRGI